MLPSSRKIVHFAKYYLPRNGGIESVTASLARAALGAGFQVTIVCFGERRAPFISLEENVRVIRASVHGVVASQPLSFAYLYFCFRESRSAHIVHIHAPNMLAALCSLFVARKARVVVHWHSDVINKGLWGVLLRPLEQALLKRADRVIATSRIYADASTTLWPFRDKITVVPIGVPDVPHAWQHTSDHGLSDYMRERLGDKKVVLAVGRLVPYKGFHVLIEAAQHLREEAIVVIVGDGPQREELQLAAAKVALKGRVEFMGRVDDSMLQALFRRASVYCLPSIDRAEAFGVVLIEAMAHGLPIVATAIPGSGVPWVNKHGVSGINVPVGEPVALADACNRILASDDERNRLSRGARGRFLSKFTEASSTRRIMDVYTRLSTSSD